MKTISRFFVAALALATVGLGLSACDASPYAATANGQTIKELDLNARLAEWAANKPYVAAQNSSAQQNSGGIAITGTGSGTYTTAFVANTLGQMVVEVVLHQHLAATGSLPGPGLLAAARGFYDAEAAQSYWFGFPDKLRDALTTSLAEEAAVVPPSTSVSSLKQGYAQLGSFMWTQACVSQSSAFSLADAQSVEAAGVPSGTPVCWTQAQLEDQPAAYRSAVFALTVGQVSKPVKTSFGYEVVKLVSRQNVPLDADTSKVLTVLLDAGNGVALPALATLVHDAKVKVNPTYGTWNAKQGVVQAPQLKSS